MPLLVRFSGCRVVQNIWHLASIYSNNAVHFTLGNMQANELWRALHEVAPERVARQSHQIGTPVGSAQNLIDQLSDLCSCASIANGKCGYIGNPYEIVEEDYVILLASAERISGLSARFPWERQ
jgi:hypothetical protein